MQLSFQIVNLSAIYNERVAIALGLTALVFALATFFSCRTFVSLIKIIRIKNPLTNKAYQSFSRYHTYYWFGFGVAVVAHLMMAAFHTGFPAAGDPDAGIHWAILLVGLGGVVSSIALFTTCRVSPRLLAPKTQKLSLQNRVYRSFFIFHSYYWLAFILLIAAHFAIGYLHAGIWPA